MEAVPRMPMLSFELKHSPEYVEFGPTLKKYIRDHYGEDPAHYNKSCNELEQLRQSAVHVSHDFMGCSTLKKYYSQLQFLQGRFPMLEGGEASIPFTWEEVFSGREMTLSDIKFEQACVLYNIGALHSVLGAMDTRQSADGMKVSCTHFQCASWAFEYLRDHFGCAAMSLDMTHELLTFQLNLMLAQAQECILEKSMTDSRKSTITAKVAAQIVEFYKTSLKHLDVCNSQELISSKRYKDWKKRIDLKVLFYTCITDFYMGRQSEDQQKHGQCLAYYTIALEKLTECEKLAKNEGVEIQDSLRFTHDVVGGKHQAAKKDNDFVYHDKVPPADSLPEVKGASLVKGIPFNPNDPEISGPDIFQKLVPMSAHEAASLYSEEKATLLRRVVSEIQEKNEELNRYLASLQLDQTSLNPEPERLPQQLLEKCAALSVRPTAIKELVDSMTAVSNVATEVDLGIQEIQQTLQEESKAELEFQETFGKRNPNAILSEIAQECARLEEGHKKGSQSNTDLHKAMNTHINNLKLLSSPLEDLQKLLPSVDKDRDPESNDIIKQLNNLLSKIEEMRTQRQTFEDQLRKEVMEDDITGVLCKQEGMNREVLFSEQLKKHDKTSSLIKQNLTAQDNILRALTDANAKYASVRKATSEALVRREQTIRDLINSYDVYEDLKAKSQKGLDFYKKLEINVGRLLTRCKNVCKVQQDERQKMYNKYKPKAPAPTRPIVPKAAPVDQADEGQVNDTSAVPHPPAHTVAAMFDGPKLKDYLPFMKPKSFGKKDGSPPISTAHPSVQDFMSQGGSLPNSGTASPVHMPQMPGSVPASPDHVRNRFDGRLGPRDQAALGMLPRQPGPDLTQGHLYQPVSSAGQIVTSEGQTAFRGQGRIGQDPSQMGSSLYGTDLPVQQQLGQIGYTQGQGAMPDGIETSQHSSLQSDYVPLDQRWKKDKPVTPQSSYQQGQRPTISRSLKPQPGQAIQPNVAPQPIEDQQSFYAQKIAFANQELAYGQQGPEQRQAISNRSFQSQLQTNQFDQGGTYIQNPMVSQPFSHQLIQNFPESQRTSQAQPVMPPQTMPATREITNTVSTVGGPVLSPGNEGQDLRTVPQGSFPQQGQRQSSQQQMTQPGFSDGQQQAIQPGYLKDQQVQGQTTEYPGGQFHPKSASPHLQQQQQPQQPLSTYDPQISIPSTQSFRPQNQGPVFHPNSSQYQQVSQQITPFQQQVGQGQTGPQNSLQAGQYSQTQPQYSQSQINAQHTNGLQPAGQVSLPPTTALGQYIHGGTVTSQTSQYPPNQQQPVSQQSSHGQGQFQQVGHPHVQNIPQSSQQPQVPSQQSMPQVQQAPLSVPYNTSVYSSSSVHPGMSVAQQGVQSVAVVGQQNFQQYQPNQPGIPPKQYPAPASVGAAVGQQQSFVPSTQLPSSSSGAAVGNLQTSARFVAPSSMPQQNVIPPSSVTGFQNVQHFQPQPFPQGQNVSYPQHSSSVQSMHGVGAMQAGPRYCTPTSVNPQQNLPAVQQPQTQQAVQSQQTRMQPQNIGQGQGQPVRGFSPVPVGTLNQPAQPLPYVTPVPGQGQVVQGQATQHHAQPLPYVTPVPGQGQVVQGQATQHHAQGQIVSQPSLPSALGQGQYVQGQTSQQQFKGQQIGQQPQRPQAPNYSDTFVNRQFTQGQIPSQGQVGQSLQSQGLQNYQQNQPISSQSQQMYSQGQQGLWNQQQRQVPSNQRPGVPNQTVPQPYGQDFQGQVQGKVQYGQTSNQSQTGTSQQFQQMPPQGLTNQSVLQPQVLKQPVLPSGGQGQNKVQPEQQNIPISHSQGQNQTVHQTQQQPLQSQHPVQPQQPVYPQQPTTQPQGLPSTPSYQAMSPMHGSYQQGQSQVKKQDPAVRPRSPVEAKPAQPIQQGPQVSPAKNIPTHRQLSTASSLDEILSSSPEARSERSESVLAPKVLTAQEIQQQKEDQLKNSSLHTQPKDPYKDKPKLNRFVAEVEKLAKFVEGFEKPLCSGPTPLDVVWKELMEEQDRAGRHQKLAIARCYPMKNRDQDIMPYDDSRVLLTTLKDDYINASWVNDLSPSCPKFIATQAPLPVTLIDYWLMVYEQGVEVLVALSGDTETGKKFPSYLPVDKGHTVEHGPVQLTLQSVKHKQFWTERILHLRHAETRTGRTLVHLHYSAWPVSGFPDKVSHILQFITEVHSFYRQQRSLLKPIVVHCGNGVGRTGMFQLIYVGMQEINHGDGIINIQEVAGKMLWRRRYIILKQDQLKYCYEAILYYAQDVLAKEGILVHKASFGDELPKPGAKATGWEPGQDILFGSMSFTNLQSNIAKMSMKSDSDSSSIDKKLEMLKRGETSELRDSVVEQKLTEQNMVIPEGQVISSIGGNSLPDVVQSPGINFERKSADSVIVQTQDEINWIGEHGKKEENVKVQEKTESVFSDLGLLECNKTGSFSSLKSQDSTDSKGSRVSSVHVSPAHQSREVSSSPKPENVSSSLAELQDPTKFTIGTSEGSKRKITKSDFTGERKTVPEPDPNDPFSSLDPLWTHK